jgi:hypothetical protein
MTTIVIFNQGALMNNLKKIALLAFVFILSSQAFSQKKVDAKSQNVVQLTLIRDKQTDSLTLGKIYCDGVFIAYTLERPWKCNKNEVSSIPVGSYFCKIRCPYESGKFKYEHLIVENVPGRSHILFHVGNQVKDSHGCILTGLVRGDGFLSESKKAHSKLMAALSGKKASIKLTVKSQLV